MGFERSEVGSTMTRPWLRHGISGEWPWIDRELEENKVLNESSGEVSGSTCYSPTYARVKAYLKPPYCPFASCCRGNLERTSGFKRFDGQMV